MPNPDIIATGFVNTPKYLFHLIVPLKSVSSLQSFSKVHRSLVHVTIVIDYVDTVSA